MKVFKKILIANRGEIVVRIIRSAKKLGIQTVAIYAEADQDSLHVQLADDAYCIGVRELSETYLNIEKIIHVAIESGCDAIHPGYGFLAENPSFVEACEKTGIIFIGPNTRAIRLMGNKIESREFVSKLGIPMTKGVTGTSEELIKKSSAIPFPLLVKAAAGGGGKGMRIVRKPGELKEVLESTSREAKNYFGDGTIYIEKYIEEPRHIEFQIMGDNHGNVIHIFERECTIQRRYQKIIEESPSPTLTPEIRKKMGEAAVKISKEIGYNSAGTMEFLVDKDLNFYFLEMNTRIQVEHPVTEMVTGVDLVEEQILVAAGNKLRLKQNELKQNGHAIECRVYAEDPEKNFIPSPGKITFYKQPSGENVRVDSGIDGAVEIKSFYDPMIAKLIVWAENREIATEKSINALREFIVHGIKTNVSYLLGMLKHEAFSRNKLSTKFCDEHTREILSDLEKEKEKLGIKLPLFAYTLHSLNLTRKTGSKNIWERIGYWRNIMEIPFVENGNVYKIKFENIKNGSYTIEYNKKQYHLLLDGIENNMIRFKTENRFVKAYISTDKNAFGWVSIDGVVFRLTRKDLLNENFEFITSGQGDNQRNLFAPMPGKVIKVNVKKGDKVKRGTIMLVVEAMKMENNITALEEAVVKEITVKEGEMVDTDKQLVFLEKNT